VQSTIGKGTRSSSATAYLSPALNRTNLHVLIQNTVTKLVQTGNQSEIPTFKTVKFAANSACEFFKIGIIIIFAIFKTPFAANRTLVSASKEIILSAGSIGTPQILMLSGIGDPKALNALGIEPAVNLSDVGQNLQDHPIMSNYWLVKSNATFDDVLRESTLASAALSQWLANRTGLFSNAPADGIAFLRLPNNASIFSTTKDPSAGPGSAHFEMIWGNGYAATVLPQPATGHFTTINTAVVSPTSRGSIHLASTDPFAFPIINPNFFNSTFDQFAMLSAVKAARAFMETAPWDGFVQSRFGPVGSAESDEQIIAASRDAIVTIWHPTSTARMSPKNASWGVVDPQLLVKGVKGLRVVDASIIVSATTVMLSSTG
jgi:choline dehydrogenase-like flavoprotein